MRYIYTSMLYICTSMLYICTCMLYICTCMKWYELTHTHVTYTAPETSKWWDFLPKNTHLVDLYYPLRTKCYLGFVPQWVSRGRYPLVSSGPVRHPLDSKTLFVTWLIRFLCLVSLTAITEKNWNSYPCTTLQSLQSKTKVSILMKCHICTYVNWNVMYISVWPPSQKKKWRFSSAR